ncbi:MAG: GntR family transcriptional regulator [Planctomycetota bacterium]
MQFTTLRQRAYHRIREKLIAGDLPPGAALSEPLLARELGMSRTPIREAIRQMEMEGLVAYSPRFGATVRLLDREELAEMYVVREALESYAAADAARRITDAELNQVELLWRQMQEIDEAFRRSGTEHLEGDLLRRFLAVDMRFHQLIIRAAGNRYMSKVLEDTRLLARVFASATWLYDRPTLDEANSFHLRLLNALKQHDPEAARQCTIEAMHVSRRNAMKRFELQDNTEGTPIG